jgi:hypothetical protein
VNDGGDGRGGLTVAGLSCNSCGTQLGGTAKFCSECGTPVASPTRSAEYKQVTVLFADVVHSMDIAASFALSKQVSHLNILDPRRRRPEMRADPGQRV